MSDPSTAFRALHDGWSLTAVTISGDAPAAVIAALTDGVPAVVPGEAHLDLRRAGLIGDPFDGGDEAEQQWIGDTTWRSSAPFTWSGDAAQRHDLVAYGLDTVATVELNGHLVGRTQNMHRGYRWDVRGALRNGQNTLTVTFAAPVPEAVARAERDGALPHADRARRRACRRRRTARRRPHRARRRGAARHRHRRRRTYLHGRRRQGARRGTLVAHRVRRPAAVRSARGGVRRGPRRHMAEPRRLPNHRTRHHAGRRRRAVRGPCQRRTDTRARRQLDPRPRVPHPGRPRPLRPPRHRCCGSQHQPVAGVGGGIYESDDLYDLADEQGLLMWQDFLFACAAYREDLPARAEIEDEARENVARLSRHPSLVLWNGNNENTWGSVDWGGPVNWTARAGATPTTATCCRACSPSSTPPAPTHRRARIRSAITGIRTTNGTAPCTSGTCGTVRTTPVTPGTSRVSSPSSASRGRPPGPP
ncbi:glycosyl hydrolase 2 galactose-binding domain-containing protein [Actinoplanes sp. NPDC004185]